MPLASLSAAELLLEIGGLLLVMGVLARVADRFALPSIPVFLAVGLVVSSTPLRPDVSREFVEIGATIGVALLLFMLGVKYSADELTEALRSNSRAGLVDALANATPGAVIAALLGWGALEALVLAGACWVSSSGMVAKLVEDLRWTGNRETPVVISVLVMEDLAMAVYLPVTAGLLAGGSAPDSIVRVVVALAVVGVVITVALRWGERLSDLAFSESSEHMLLVILGAVLLVAGFAERASVSGAVGAFLVGMGLSGPAAERAEPLLTPLRDLFGAVYFLFFGLAIDTSALRNVLVPALVMAVLTGPTKLWTGWWSARRAGLGSAGRLRAGTVLMARGEFSLVVAGLAVGAGLEAELPALVTAYVLILALVTPLAARVADRRSQKTPRTRRRAAS
ncbi:MAG: potassium transporter [Acidimicrobiales bacterium]|nr:MAG: potassium transporter [Acidimicrobiales bacterium]